MLISDAASGFLNYMSAQGLSQSTINTAAIVLRHMQRVTGPIDVADIQPSHIDGMFSNQEWGMGTRNNYLMHVRGFMKWCRTHKLVAPDYDPCAGWRTHKVVKRQRTWLTLPVLAAMLQDSSPRDRAFMALGIFTFMRASEIAALKIGDLDFNDNEIDIFRIKTKQEDRIPMCIELRQELTHWLLHYRDMCGDLDPDWLVIPSQHPTPMKGVPGVRKLGAYAPYGLTMFDKLRDVRDTKVGTDPEALCEDLATANDVMIANINVALKEALSSGEQGIANFLAERDDMHKKWRWQLEASVA